MDTRQLLRALESLEDIVNDAERENRDLTPAEERIILKRAHDVAENATSDLILDEVKAALDQFESDPLRLADTLISIAYKWEEGDYTER